MEQNENTKLPIVPLYAARIEHLIHAKSIAVKCSACGHVADVAVKLLWARLPGWSHLSDLHRQLRCVECDVKGQCTIDARHALGHVELDRRMAEHEAARNKRG